MSEKRPDRRIGRTKRLLKGALLELIRERPYEEITIGEIADRADVGRSTFYSHFQSKHDLLLDGFDRALVALADSPAASGESRRSGFRFSLPLLRHVRSQREFFLATIIGAGDARLRARITDLFAQMIRAELARRSGQAPFGPAAHDALAEGRAHAVAGAFLGIAAWWLQRAPDLSAEDVDRTFASAVRPPK